jgi:hypothetical protein
MKPVAILEGLVDDAKWERWGALAAIVFVVLLIASILIGGSPPKTTDSPAKITKYFRDNQDSLKVGSYLSGVALIPFLWFLGTLFGRLRRAEGSAGRVSGIALVGGVVTGAIAMVGSAINSYGALHPANSAGAFLVASAVLGYVSFAVAVFVGATSVVVLRTKILPSWFGWAGGAITIIWLVGAASVSTDSDAISAVGFISLIVWALWLIALGVMLYRTPQPAS